MLTHQSSALTAAAASHTAIDPAILYWGTPVALISIVNPAGTANLAPMSSVFWMGRTAVLGLGLSSHTAANLVRTRECVLNLPAEHQVDLVDRLALTTGAAQLRPWKLAAGYSYCADKFGLAGATPVASDKVDVPRVAETPVAMEARLISDHVTDMHLLTVRVERVHVHPQVRMHGSGNRIDPDKWRPFDHEFSAVLRSRRSSTAFAIGVN